MTRLLSWLIGLAIGAALGATLVYLFAPASGEQIKARIKRGWDETMDEARNASQQRRRELEAELAQMQKKNKLPVR
jgi:gas vesicle protein